MNLKNVSNLSLMPAHAVASKKIKKTKKLSILTFMLAHALASKKLKI